LAGTSRLVVVDVTQVVSALNGLPGAAVMCRDDLEHGARLVVLPGLVDAGEIRTAYRRRAEHLDGQGADASEAYAAAERLEATSAPDLALGKVEGGPSGHIFQLFLTPRLDEVVACLVLPRNQDLT
jgi:hypothetical protein